VKGPATIILGLLAVFSVCAPARGGLKPEKIPGTVVLSDGTRLTGQVYLTPGKKLRVFDGEHQRWHQFGLGEIARVTCGVARDSMLDKWTWKEDTSDEKLFRSDEYWKREYSLVIRLHSGLTVHGYGSGVIYVEVDKKKYRFILKRNERHPPNKKPQDIVYLTDVILRESEGAGTGGAILGAMQPAPLVTAVKAIRADGMGITNATLETATLRYRIGGLAPGVYDLGVETEDAFYVGLSGKTALDEKSLAGLQNHIDHIREFFEVRKVRLAAVEGKAVKVLIASTRRRKTSFEGMEAVHRFDIYTMHEFEGDWVIDKRLFLSRQMILKDEPGKPRRLVIEPRLAGVKVSGAPVEFDLGFLLEEVQ